MARAVNIPMPLKGLNTVDPFNQSLEYARELSDFQIYQGRLSVRPARDSIYPTVYNTSKANWYDVPGNEGIAYNGDRVTITTGAVAGNIGGTCQTHATAAKHVTSTFLFGCRQPRIATQPFTAWTFTTAAITATAILCGCSWKGRLYVTDGSSIEYSNLGAIGASALNGGVPISYNMNGQTVIRMLVMTGSNQANILTDAIFVIFGNAGRVLMYSGTDPTDWVQIGQWDMPAPISNLGFVEIDGDIFVVTKQYAYWARDLLIGGAAYAYSNSPSRPVENLLQGLRYLDIPGTSNAPLAQYLGIVQGVDVDCIVITPTDAATTVPELTLLNVANVGGPSLAYFRKYKAWALWFTAFRHPAGGIPDLIAGTTTYYCNDLNGAFALEEISYNSSGYVVYPTWSTPYLNPFTGKNQKLLGVRPYFGSDVPEITVGGVADFSDLKSPYGFQAQATAVAPVTPGVYAEGTIIEPANTYEQYRPYGAIGVDGGGVSLYARMQQGTGASYTLKKQIYQMIAYFEDGGDLY